MQEFYHSIIPLQVFCDATNLCDDPARNDDAIDPYSHVALEYSPPADSTYWVTGSANYRTTSTRSKEFTAFLKQHARKVSNFTEETIHTVKKSLYNIPLLKAITGHPTQ